MVVFLFFFIVDDCCSPSSGLISFWLQGGWHCCSFFPIMGPYSFGIFCPVLSLGQSICSHGVCRDNNGCLLLKKQLHRIITQPKQKNHFIIAKKSFKNIKTFQFDSQLWNFLLPFTSPFSYQQHLCIVSSFQIDYLSHHQKCSKE